VERPTARCDRESERASMPPRLWALVDEAALRRPVAAPEVMYEQCMASACPRPVADRPRDEGALRIRGAPPMRRRGSRC
jgi:hypothetical protein